MRILILLMLLALSIFIISCVDFGTRPEEGDDDDYHTEFGYDDDVNDDGDDDDL